MWTIIPIYEFIHTDPFRSRLGYIYTNIVKFQQYLLMDKVGIDKPPSKFESVKNSISV